MPFAVRLDPELERALAAVARQEGRSRSDVVRAALRQYVAGSDVVAEARRQSRIVRAAEEDEAEVLDGGGRRDPMPAPISEKSGVPGAPRIQDQAPA